MPIYGSKTGFRDLRDVLLFVIGAGGIVVVMLGSRKHDINIAALTTFAGLLVGPYVLRTDEAKPSQHHHTHPRPAEHLRPGPTPRKRAPAKKAPAKKAPAKRSSTGRKR